MSPELRMKMQLGIAADVGRPVPKGARVLDLGCGNGRLVKAYREVGYDAYGCDLAFKEGPDTDQLRQQGVLLLISADPYRLPYEDRTFDFVVSDQVFEHVQDYPEVLRELSRVMRSTAVGIHTFPPRYMVIEPHVHVPLATACRPYWWLRLWAQIGVRNRFQSELSAAETAQRNFDYLHTQTNYLPKRIIARVAQDYFEDVQFCEHLFLRHSARARILADLSGLFPMISAVYSTFRGRVLLLGKPL